MQTSQISVLALSLLLCACSGAGESRLNPLNWFGQTGARGLNNDDDAEKFIRPTDQRALVDQIVSVSAENIPEGLILRATGLGLTQGYWDADLVRYEDQSVPQGTLVYDFKISAPPYRANVGSKPSREIIVATRITLNDLAGVSQIIVRGQRGTRNLRP